MIIDKIENQHLYKGLSEKIAKAFDFLNNTDLENIALGKHEIDGDDLYASFMEYETKEISEAKPEGHQKYIDLQYMISGNEMVGLTSFTGQTPVEVIAENDLEFYDIPTDLMAFKQGTFMIFFPDDLHQPGIKFGEKAMIRKVVIKIKA